jgi:predicted ester cyclase
LRKIITLAGNGRRIDFAHNLFHKLLLGRIINKREGESDEKELEAKKRERG